MGRNGTCCSLRYRWIIIIVHFRDSRISNEWLQTCNYIIWLQQQQPLTCCVAIWNFHPWKTSEQKDGPSSTLVHDLSRANLGPQTKLSQVGYFGRDLPKQKPFERSYSRTEATSSLNIKRVDVLAVSCLICLHFSHSNSMAHTGWDEHGSRDTWKTKNLANSSGVEPSPNLNENLTSMVRFKGCRLEACSWGYCLPSYPVIDLTTHTDRASFLCSLITEDNSFNRYYDKFQSTEIMNLL